MGLLSWIILGLIAGVIADMLMGGGFGLIGSIILGSSARSSVAISHRCWDSGA